MIRIYRGTRDVTKRLHVITVRSGGDWLPLHHYIHHSPDGFECGYLGSGPADLALALCADAIGAEDQTVQIFRGRVGLRAWSAHQHVKQALVARLPRDASWELTHAQVMEAIEAWEALKR